MSREWNLNEHNIQLKLGEVVAVGHPKADVSKYNHVLDCAGYSGLNDKDNL